MATFRFEWNMPAEIDPEESDILIDFNAEPAERQTFDYPGSPATVEIDRVYAKGREIEVTEELMPFLVEAAWGYLESLDSRGN